MQKETFFYSVPAMIEENQLGSFVPTCAYVICVVHTQWACACGFVIVIWERISSHELSSVHTMLQPPTTLSFRTKSLLSCSFQVWCSF